MSYHRMELGQTYADAVDAALAQLGTQLRSTGQGLSTTQVSLNVTDRTDAEIALAQQRVAQTDFTAVVFVDDHLPPRPGTTSSSALHPLARSAATEARAARILGDQGHTLP